MAYYPITPVAKPRATQRDKFKPSAAVLRYRAFCDEARLRMGALDLVGKAITWHIAMPRSWSMKQRKAMVGTPHLQTPDVSNLLKALEDALYSKRYTGRDDKVIWHTGELKKLWAWTGAIEIAD